MNCYTTSILEESAASMFRTVWVQTQQTPNPEVWGLQTPSYFRWPHLAAKFLYVAQHNDGNNNGWQKDLQLNVMLVLFLFAEVSAEATGFPWAESIQLWSKKNSLNKTWHLTSPLPKQIHYSVHNTGITQYPPLCYAFWPESARWWIYDTDTKREVYLI